jgi:protein-S-isoprenylcysteine O-methyltransferase Ste14
MSIFWLIIAVLVWGLLHSLFASLEAKDLFLRWFGAAFMRFFRLGYNLFSLLTFLPILALLRALPDRPLYAIPMPWAILTALGQVAAVLILAIGLLQTGPLDFLGLRPLLDARSQPARLVTGGLYRRVRHPLYFGGLLFIWLTPGMTINRLAFYLALSVYLLIATIFEERKLLREFGSAYAVYRARTPMLIPRPRGNKPVPPPS